MLPFLMAAAGKVGTAETIAGAGQRVAEAVSHLGKGQHYPFATIWEQMPFAYLRLEGGHGRWHDPLTGQVTNDLGSDVRKIAVVASGMGMYVDAHKRMFFNDGRPVSPADSWQTWNDLYGTPTFQEAYTRNPAAFRIFGDTPGNDPAIGQPSTPPALQPALPVNVPLPLTAPGVALPAYAPPPTPQPLPGATPAAAAPAGVPVPNAGTVVPSMPWYKTPLGIVAIAAGVLLVVKSLGARG